MTTRPASECSERLKEQGYSYPRTCRACGLGPCQFKVVTGVLPVHLVKLAEDYRQAQSAADLARLTSKQAMQRANAADDALGDARAAFHAAVNKLLDGE